MCTDYARDFGGEKKKCKHKQNRFFGFLMKTLLSPVQVIEGRKLITKKLIYLNRNGESLNLN